MAPKADFARSLALSGVGFPLFVRRETRQSRAMTRIRRLARSRVIAGALALLATWLTYSVLRSGEQRRRAWGDQITVVEMVHDATPGSLLSESES